MLTFVGCRNRTYVPGKSDPSPLQISIGVAPGMLVVMPAENAASSSWLVRGRAGFCCGPNGNRHNLIPDLPPLPVEYDTIINDERISRLSCWLNLIFSFAALESSHSFPTPGNPSFIVISGRIYHQLQNGPRSNSAVRWLLYDGFDVASAPHNNDLIPQSWISTLQECLLQVNPLARSVYFLHDLQVNNPDDFASASVVVCDTGVSEIAAIMCYDNTTLSHWGQTPTYPGFPLWLHCDFLSNSTSM